MLKEVLGPFLPERKAKPPKPDISADLIAPQQLPSKGRCLRSRLPEFILNSLISLKPAQESVLQHFGVDSASFAIGHVALLECRPACNSRCLVVNVNNTLALANTETLDDLIVPCPHVEETKALFQKLYSETRQA